MLVQRQVLEVIASRYGVEAKDSEEMLRKAEEMLRKAIEDVAEMLRRFVRARQYSFVDRLANAAGKEVVSAMLYEALRISESTLKAGRTLDENVRPYVASESSIKLLLDLLDLDLVSGLEAVKRCAVLALTYPARAKEEEEKEEGEGQAEGGVG
jgi:CRISPR type I-A-associated protein Csa5